MEGLGRPHLHHGSPLLCPISHCLTLYFSMRTCFMQRHRGRALWNFNKSNGLTASQHPPKGLSTGRGPPPRRKDRHWQCDWHCNPITVRLKPVLPRLYRDLKDCSIALLLQQAQCGEDSEEKHFVASNSCFTHITRHSTLFFISLTCCSDIYTGT